MANQPRTVALLGFAEPALTDDQRKTIVAKFPDQEVGFVTIEIGNDADAAIAAVEASDASLLIFPPINPVFEKIRESHDTPCGAAFDPDGDLCEVSEANYGFHGPVDEFEPAEDGPASDLDDVGNRA